MRSAAVACVLVVATAPAPSPGGPADAVDGRRALLTLQGLGLLSSHGVPGLGGEATACLDWATAHAPVRLVAGEEAARLQASDGSSRPVSIELARAVRRLTDHGEMVAASRRDPVATTDLERAFLRAETVARVRALFELSVADGLSVRDHRAFPELGGEAVLVDGMLELRTIDDPTRDLLRAVAAAPDSPRRVGELLRESADAAALADPVGQLEREVELWHRRTERGVAEARRRRVWDLAVETFLLNAADSFVLHPRRQLDGVIAHEWHGRLVGPWHLHPPGWSAEGFRAGDGPSPDDLRVASQAGQFLTIVFRPSGFDAHDLQTPVGARPSPDGSRVIRHRSPAWREHFAHLHAALRGAE